MICVNTFGQNNYIIKYLVVNAINLNNLPEEKCRFVKHMLHPDQ